VTKYLQKIRDDTCYRMGTVHLHPFAADIIIVDRDGQIPKHVAENHLQKHLNLDSGFVVEDYRDVPGLIKGKHG
jgi:hypothetical protein